MFFRIQSIYLILTSITSGIFSFIFPFHTYNGVDIMLTEKYDYLFLFSSSTLISLISLFYYKNRKTQFILCRINILLNLVLIVLFLYRSYTIYIEKGIGLILPVIIIIFLVLANKAIKKDEDLIKSVDRLR